MLFDKRWKIWLVWAHTHLDHLKHWILYKGAPAVQNSKPNFLGPNWTELFSISLSLSSLDIYAWKFVATWWFFAIDLMCSFINIYSKLFLQLNAILKLFMGSLLCKPHFEFSAIFKTKFCHGGLHKKGIDSSFWANEINKIVFMTATKFEMTKLSWESKWTNEKENVYCKWTKSTNIQAAKTLQKELSAIAMPLFYELCILLWWID